jgi:hypothetical protein
MLPLLAILLLAQTPAPATPPSPLERLPFDAKAVDRKHVLKDVVQGARWKDANGENLVVLSSRTRRRPCEERRDGACSEEEVSDVELQAVHVVRKDGRERELRRVRDSTLGCSFDNETKFLKDSLEVSDLDRDGVGEVLFAYFLQCTSDVSPATLKLLLLENGDKYILRGQNSLKGVERNAPEGPPPSVDASFDEGPRVFRAHALQRWSQWKDRSSFGDG